MRKMASSKEAEATVHAASMDGIPPPPYQETDSHGIAHPPAGPAPSYHVGESVSGAGFISSGGVKFPPTLNAYFPMAFTKTFHLGERKEAPSFAVRMHSGFTKNPELVLYNGPSEKDPILATANYESLWKSKTTLLTVPAREGKLHDDESQSVKMACHWSLKHQTFTFAADIGVGKETRREEFEWRSSHGNEVRELDGYKWGWKLVRLSSEPLGGGGERATRASGSTSDGLEVVAVWAHNNSMSMTKAFKFQFIGSALNGMLGERGAALALISAIRIWSLELNTGTASSSVAAVAAG
ncbi:hypothetical protein F4859DRAFT_494337 [Xylaria cf. heliscus]|nr:hypothetical protein F4859DRAFT_494337 [Xylaria cf. heliscus]